MAGARVQVQANVCFSKVIPPLLVLATAYSVYVFLAGICISTLLRDQHRHAAAAALAAAFLGLLLLMAVSFARLLLAPPGFASEDWDRAEPRAYVCDPAGARIWCAVCRLHKPDRAHHCSEVGRCVLKMDHYCPWVGGIVGFSRYKFFLQFVVYVALYTLYIVIATSILLHQRLVLSQHISPTWIALLALAAFFALLMIPFSCIHITYTLHNQTTLEAINSSVRSVFLSIQYTPSSRGVITTDKGENPWDRGYLENWKSVMGIYWWDWFLPIHSSPGDGCTFPYNDQTIARLCQQVQTRDSLPIYPTKSVSSR